MVDVILHWTSNLAFVSLCAGLCMALVFVVVAWMTDGIVYLIDYPKFKLIGKLLGWTFLICFILYIGVALITGR